MIPTDYIKNDFCTFFCPGIDRHGFDLDEHLSRAGRRFWNFRSR